MPIDIDPPYRNLSNRSVLIIEDQNNLDFLDYLLNTTQKMRTLPTTIDFLNISRFQAETEQTESLVIHVPQLSYTRHKDAVYQAVSEVKHGRIVLCVSGSYGNELSKQLYEDFFKLELTWVQRNRLEEVPRKLSELFQKKP